MRILTRVDEVRRALADDRAKGRSIGFVPTMGYFHAGHLSLMRAARETCDIVVVSIFVNPTQFAPDEDFGSYPRDVARDKRMAEEVGVDYVFTPTVEEMYRPRHATYVEVEGPVTGVLCAAGRPGHFRGVATVVAKLFNIVEPDKAFFGQKDAQQAIVIRRMVEDLDMPVEVVVCPIVREADGLAMSSRNVYLSEKERQAALVLVETLKAAEEMIGRGERDAGAVKSAIERLIRAEPLACLEYASVCDTIHLDDVQEMKGEVLIAVAARFGKARLIDNTIIRLKAED